MSETIQLGELSILVTRKDIKNVHLSVYAPDGRVTLVAPVATHLDVARAYAVSRLSWIRQQQAKLKSQARETPRKFIERESHNLWGRRYLLSIVEKDEKPSIQLSHHKITLCVRPGSDMAKREAVIHEWHKALLHGLVPQLIKKMGSETRCRCVWLFLTPNEDKMGKLQPPRGKHPAQHGTGEEAKGLTGVRRRARNSPLN